jgi:hypothetical protein
LPFRAAIPLIAAGVTLAAAPAAHALITIAATPAVLSDFAPASSATGSGALTVSDTSGTWTLQAEDQGSGAGHMTAAAVGCTGSDAQLADPLQLSVTNLPSGAVSGGTISLSATNQTVASATDQSALVADVLTTNFTQPIPATELMRVGCLYSLTVTFTLQ